MLVVTAVLVAACPSPGGGGGGPGGNPPPEVALTFEQAAVRRSKMLVSTNGNAPQTYTNTLSLGATPVTSGASYRISANPGGHTPEEISVNERTGEVTFTKALYDKMTPPDLTQPTGPPATVTVQAAYQGKTASYRFTVTDHFRPRRLHTSVVVGNDIYVIGGSIRDSGSSTAATITAVQSSEVWRSSDEGLTWDQVADTRFTARASHGSVVLNGALYVIAGVGGSIGITPRDDVWKSTDRGVNWSRITPAGGGVDFPMDNAFASAVRGDAIYLLGGIRRLPFARLNEVWQSVDGVSWTNITATTATSPPRFPARSEAASVVTGGGGARAFYLIGGYDNRDDVWTSANGTSWTHANASAAAGERFPGRSSHSAVAVSEAGGDALYVIGGLRSGVARSDVWKSVDQGATWNQVVANAEFSGRREHSSVVLGGELYVIGGARFLSEFFNDVWKSADGGRTWVNVHKN